MNKTQKTVAIISGLLLLGGVGYVIYRKMRKATPEEIAEEGGGGGGSSGGGGGGSSERAGSTEVGGTRPGLSTVMPMYQTGDYKAPIPKIAVIPRTALVSSTSAPTKKTTTSTLSTAPTTTVKTRPRTAVYSVPKTTTTTSVPTSR